MLIALGTARSFGHLGGPVEPYQALGRPRRRRFLRKNRLCSSCHCISLRAGFGSEFEFDRQNLRNSSYFEPLAAIHFFVITSSPPTSACRSRTPWFGRSATRASGGAACRWPLLERLHAVRLPLGWPGSQDGQAPEGYAAQLAVAQENQSAI